jgi:hypothetical protein
MSRRRRVQHSLVDVGPTGGGLTPAFSD